jgi:hypothetical protein
VSVPLSSRFKFHRSHPDTFNYPPKFVSVWVAAKYVNCLALSNGGSGEIDLLSPDIDGIDYWIWKTIEVESLKVLIAEVQAIWGVAVSVAVPYRPDFTGEFVQEFGRTLLPEIPAEQYFTHPFTKCDLRPLVVGRDWEKV